MMELGIAAGKVQRAFQACRAPSGSAAVVLRQAMLSQQKTC
jgi:hypothetical protein